MMQKAMFAAGCFWGVEARFRRLDGVVDTAVGYSGGTVDNPTYQQVCNGDTGHAEVVLVEYDPQRIAYEDLLDYFWQIHDPTTPNRQGPDVGSQYRSAIFYFDGSQRSTAENSRARAQAERYPGRPITTEIEGAGPFYRAEEYHQRYLEKNPQRSCW